VDFNSKYFIDLSICYIVFCVFCVFCWFFCFCFWYVIWIFTNYCNEFGPSDKLVWKWLKFEGEDRSREI